MEKWSLGVLGDLMWEIFPSLRSHMKDLICERLERAIRIDEVLYVVEGPDFIIHVLGPYVSDPIDEDREAPGDVVRLAEFIRRALAYDGPNADYIHDQVGLYLIENIETKQILDKISAVDEHLLADIRERFPGWLSYPG